MKRKNRVMRNKKKSLKMMTMKKRKLSKKKHQPKRGRK